MEIKTINYKLLKQVYKRLAVVYIDTINYNSQNDIKSLLNNQYQIHKKYYRQKVFKFTGQYFDDDTSREIFKDIMSYIYNKRLNDPGIEISAILIEWKNNKLSYYSTKAQKQIIDEDYRFTSKLKKIIKQIYRIIKYTKHK